MICSVANTQTTRFYNGCGFFGAQQLGNYLLMVSSHFLLFMGNPAVIPITPASDGAEFEISFTAGRVPSCAGYPHSVLQASAGKYLQ